MAVLLDSYLLLLFGGESVYLDTCIEGMRTVL